MSLSTETKEEAKKRIATKMQRFTVSTEGMRPVRVFDVPNHSNLWAQLMQSANDRLLRKLKRECYIRWINNGVDGVDFTIGGDKLQYATVELRGLFTAKSHVVECINGTYCYYDVSQSEDQIQVTLHCDDQADKLINVIKPIRGDTFIDFGEKCLVAIDKEWCLSTE
jgi:hypothetical protein